MPRSLPMFQVTDFGLAKFHEKKAISTTFCGTLPWTAPEILTGVLKLLSSFYGSGEGYGRMADVYSYGVVLWELLTRAEPYQGKRKPEIFLGVTKQGMRPMIPILGEAGAATPTPGLIQNTVPEDQAEISEVIKEYNKDPESRIVFDQVIGCRALANIS